MTPLNPLPSFPAATLRRSTLLEAALLWVAVALLMLAVFGPALPASLHQHGFALRSPMLEIRFKLMRHHGQHSAGIQQRLAGSVWAQCRSWYRMDSGKVVAIFPGYTAEYARAVARPDLGAYRLHGDSRTDEAFSDLRDGAASRIRTGHSDDVGTG